MKLKKLQNISKELTILYIEDEKQSREGLSKTLRALFNKVIVALDGLAGLQSFQTQKNNIDLILTDLRMPKLDGISMIRKIREIDKSIPIIVLSAHSEIENFLETIKLGIDGYILKPVNIDMFNTVLTKCIEKIVLKKENDTYKKSLEKQVEEEIQRRVYQEKLLIQQSKLAAMGEIIDAVAHQWRQPLTTLSCSVDMLQYDFEDGLIDKKYIQEYIFKFKKQLNHTLDTLKEFRSFFRPNLNKTKFNVIDMVHSTLLLVEDEFIRNNIYVEIDNKDNFYLNGNENEFKHIVLNIINNAKDAFIENNISNRRIKISIIKKHKKQRIEFVDNAGGIPDSIINDMFLPNTTTKSLGKGTGIGLYLVSLITQKFNARIYAEKTKDGSKFIFEK